MSTTAKWRAYATLGASVVFSVLSSAFAAAPMSTQDAFASGKQYGVLMGPGAAAQIDAGIGQRMLPHYGTDAAEGAHFQDGRQKIDGIGVEKQTGCRTFHAGSGFAQQECDAVNFLSKNPTVRQKFSIDKVRDPLMTGSRAIAGQPSAASSPALGGFPSGGNDRQVCRVEKVKRAPTYETATCTESSLLKSQTCSKTLHVSVTMNCRPDGVFPALDMPRNAVDHVHIFAKCDVAALHRPYIEMTADAFGIEGGHVRNQLVQVPKDLSSLPIERWQRTVGGHEGLLLLAVQPHWEGHIRSVPVYILRDSSGCRPGSFDCAYHFYWEWVEWQHECDSLWNCHQKQVVISNGDGWATGVIGEIKITDNWDDQCHALAAQSL